MDWELDHQSPLPLHKQIETLLRKLIQQEKYQQGKLLPGESEIADRLGVSRNTVRQAMKRLVNEGLITRKKGVGSKVNTSMVQTGLKAWSSFTREMQSKGIDVVDYQKRVTWSTPNQTVVRQFQIDGDLEIPKLTRLRGDEDEPIVLFESYFHPRLNLKKDETFDRPLYDILEDKYNVVPEVSDEEIGAMPPSESLKDQLHIHENVPVLYRKRLVCDARDRPIEYNYCYYRSDRFEYQIRIHRDNDLRSDP